MKTEKKDTKYSEIRIKRARSSKKVQQKIREMVIIQVVMKARVFAHIRVKKNIMYMYLLYTWGPGNIYHNDGAGTIKIFIKKLTSPMAFTLKKIFVPCLLTKTTLLSHGYIHLHIYKIFATKITISTM